MATFIGEARLKELLTLIKGKIDVSSIDNLNDIGDVNITSVADKQVLSYDATSQKWVNAQGGGGGASSWDDLTDKPFESLDKNTLSVDGDGVLSVIGGGGDTTLEAYLINNNYSEDEVCIGEYEGKPLYRKVINDTFPTVVTDKTPVSKGISINDVESAINIYGSLTVNRNNPIINSVFVSGGNTYELSAYYDGTSKTLQLVTNRLTYSNVPCRVVIEYTKTTDTEGSFTPSMLTKGFRLASAPSYEIYSEDEVCIGRYVDGKPIYRKILKGHISTANGNISLNDEIDVFVNTEFYLLVSGNYVPSNRWYSSSEYNSVWYRNNFHSAGNTIGYNIVATYSTNCDYVAILQYTKTTDAPNSFTPDMIKTDVLIDEVKEQDVDDVLDEV